MAIEVAPWCELAPMDCPAVDTGLFPPSALRWGGNLGVGFVVILGRCFELPTLQHSTPPLEFYRSV